MMDTSIGFLGGGRITRVLLGGWSRAGQLPDRMVVSDSDPEVLAALRDRFTTIEAVGDASAIAFEQDVVFVALHPPVIPEVLASLPRPPRDTSIVVSLAPKITLRKLTELLRGFDRVARVIPNAPSIVGEGFNPIACSTTLSAVDREVLGHLLHPLGEHPEVAESKLEAYAVLTAMGPTYFWPMLYELVALSESFGLTQAEALDGLRHMLAGTVGTMAHAGLDAAAVQDLIPVKPLAGLDASVLATCRTKLTAVFERIKP